MQNHEEKIIAGANWAENAAEIAGNGARMGLKRSGMVIVGGLLFLILIASGALRGFFRGLSKRGKL